MDPEAPLLDGYVRPDVVDQLLLCDHLTRTRGKVDQEVERPAAKGQPHTLAPQQPFANRKFKRAELQLSTSSSARHGFKAQHEIRSHLRDVIHWAGRLCAPARSAGSGRPAAWAVAESRHCLLQYVKSVHRTAESIAAALHPGVAGDSHSVQMVPYIPLSMHFISLDLCFQACKPLWMIVTFRQSKVRKGRTSAFHKLQGQTWLQNSA